MVTIFVTGLEICLGNPLDDFMYNNLLREVEALGGMLTKYQETTGAETKGIRRTLNLFKGEVHKAMIKLRDNHSHLEQSCLKMEKGLKEYVSSEMQRFEKSVHERFDGIDVKVANLSESIGKLMKTTGTLWNVQFGKESSLELGNVRQFVKEEKRLLPNEELASAAYSRKLYQPLVLDELVTEKKNKTKAKHKSRKAKSRATAL